MLVVTALLLAGGAAAVRGAGGALSAWQLIALRSGVFLLVLAPWALRHPEAARGVNRRLLVAQALASTAFLWLYLFAVIEIPLSLATILTGTTPMWSIFSLWALYGVRPRARELLAIALAVVAVIAIAHPEGELSAGTVSQLGVAAALAAAVANALVFLCLGRLAATDSPHAVNLWLAAVALAVSVVPVARAPLPVAGHVWLAGAAYGLFALGGYTLLNRSMKSLSPTAGSLVGVMMPVFATLLGWIIFGERLSLIEIAGMAVVLACARQVSLVEIRRKLPAIAEFRWQHTPSSSAGRRRDRQRRRGGPADSWRAARSGRGRGRPPRRSKDRRG
jgi:probable blue pigment (indigoidine) exporter